VVAPGPGATKVNDCVNFARQQDNLQNIQSLHTRLNQAVSLADRYRQQLQNIRNIGTKAPGDRSN
jgi:DNA integrity scanning protein DisA with diadenylate cyclase activity